MDPAPLPSSTPSSTPIMSPRTISRTLRAREALQHQLLERRLLKWGWCLFCLRILSFTFGLAMIAMHHEHIRKYPRNLSVFLDVLPGVLAMVSAMVGLAVDCWRKSGFRFFCYQTTGDLLILCVIMFSVTRFVFCADMCTFDIALVVMTLELWVFALLLVAFDVVQTVEYHRYKMLLRNSGCSAASALTDIVHDLLSSRSGAFTGGDVLGDVSEGFRRVPRGRVV